MTSKRKATIVVTTWNEVDGVRRMLPFIRDFDAEEVFAVDGGSTDGTVELLREGGVDVRVQKSPGRGAAIREGVFMARNEIVLIFSPDGNEDPSDVPKLLDLVEGGADIAVASRFLKDSRNEEDEVAFPWRKWANQTFTWIANSLWNRSHRMTDTINGFRAFRRDVFERLGIDAAGFVIEYQMSIRAMKLGLDIREIPTREGARVGGATKAPSVRTGFVFLGFLAREVWIGTSWRTVP